MTVSLFDYETELSACAAGDRTAFFALYEHEAPAMRALAHAMLDAEQADQVVHETFVLIWRNAAGYSPAIGTARAWMYSILRHRARAHQRHAAAQPAAEPVTALPALSLAQGMSDRPGALATLPEAQRNALLLAYLHGGDFTQIAAQLGRSEPDVHVSIEAALRHLDEAVRA